MPIHERSFGILIAFIIPGWILLLGLSLRFPEIQPWVAGPIESSPTIGGFLYSMLASVALGMLASTLRWMALDPVMNFRRAYACEPDFRELRNSHEAMKSLVESHYRFYQFHGNTLVAICFAVPERWLHLGFRASEAILLGAIMIVLILGAWDTHRKYALRASRLLSTDAAGTGKTTV